MHVSLEGGDRQRPRGLLPRAAATARAIAQAKRAPYVDKKPKPGNGSTVTYSVVAVDLAGNLSPPGQAKPLRAALLRKLGASRV